MKKILYILLFFSCSIFGQHQTMLLVSQQQFANESSVDSDYQSILDEATTQGYTLPSAGDQTIQNQIIVDMKAASLWTTTDAMFYFKGSGGADFKNINWKNPTGDKAIETGAGTLIYSATGVKGDGTNYLDLKWNPTDDGDNYTQNDFSVVVSVNTAFSSNNSLIEGYTGGTTIRSFRVINANTFQYYHSTGSGSRDIQNASGTGFFVFDFDTATAYLSKDGTIIKTSGTLTTDSFPNVDFRLLKTGSSLGDAEIGCIIIGSSLNGNATNHTNIYNAINGI